MFDVYNPTGRKGPKSPERIDAEAQYRAMEARQRAEDIVRRLGGKNADPNTIKAIASALIDQIEEAGR